MANWQKSSWQKMDAGLNVSEYAKQVCKELGWPYQGNLTLFCDCISSLAYMKRVDVRGGFFSLMEAVEHAKRNGIKIDRWFFQDGRYAEIAPELPSLEVELSTENPPGSSSVVERKPN